MKKFRMFMLSAAVCVTAATFLSSCDPEMTPNPIPKDMSGIAGLYKVTSFGINIFDTPSGTYVPHALDFNDEDTVASQDLTNESACYGQGYIQLNANHTYERYYTFFDGTECATDLKEAGVWSREGDVITITSSNFNGDPSVSMDIFSTEFTYSQSAQTLTGSREQVDYTIGTNFGNGKVDFIYTKEAQ